MKYHSIKTIVDGILFDSKAEAQRYTELKLLERAGKISHLILQPPFKLIEKSKYGRDIYYYADFMYLENGHKVVEDVKGVKTAVYSLKKRLMAEKYGIEVQEVSYGHTRR